MSHVNNNITKRYGHGEVINKNIRYTMERLF